MSESKDTLMTILFDLHCRLLKDKGKFVVFTADAKLYEVVVSLKEYGHELK